MRKEKFVPTLSAIAEFEPVEELLGPVPAMTQQHYGQFIRTNRNSPHNNGICAGYAGSWLEHRAWNQPVHPYIFDSHDNLGGVITKLQAAQRPGELEPMFSVANLRVLNNVYINVLDGVNLPDECAIYVSIRTNLGKGHGFAIDTRDGDDPQLADVNSGIHRLVGRSTSQIYEYHVAAFQPMFADQDDKIVSVEYYTVASSLPHAIANPISARPAAHGHDIRPVLREIRDFLK